MTFFSCQNINLHSHYGKQYGVSSKNINTIRSSNSGYVSEENTKTVIGKDTCIQIFKAKLLTVAKIWKQPQSSLTVEWIKKMQYICTMEYYSAIKGIKVCHLLHCGWTWRVLC